MERNMIKDDLNRYVFGPKDQVHASVGLNRVNGSANCSFVGL